MRMRWMGRARVRVMMKCDGCGGSQGQGQGEDRARTGRSDISEANGGFGGHILWALGGWTCSWFWWTAMAFWADAERLRFGVSAEGYRS